ncbi:MAG: hypothetical protein ACF8Q5_00395 [Phycisphaerales bacterium JB040]
MSSRDHKRLKAEFVKFERENKGSERSRTKAVDEAMKVALGLRETLRKKSTEWKVLYSKIFDVVDDSYPLADEIIPVQEELEAAKKAKDTAKEKEIKKRFDRLEAKARKHEAEFNKIYNQLDPLDKELKQLILSIKALG